VEGLLEEGDVAGDQLFLEGDGVGGDDDALAAEEAAEDGGDEVGVGLADAGAGLDKEVAAGLLVEGVGDGLGHFQLLGAVLVGDGGGAEVAGDGAVGGEDGGGGRGDVRGGRGEHGRSLFG
jgi:hypothetical protein